MQRIKELSDDVCIELYRWFDGQDSSQFLYEYYMDDMPYGTSKARTGDPDNWLADNADSIIERFEDEIERGRLLLERDADLNKPDLNRTGDL